MKDPKSRAKHRLKSMQYEKRLNNATPAWLSEEDWQDIEEIYVLAQEMSQNADVAEPFEVDHFFPIKAQDLDGNDVGCGLHVPWNLVIEPRSKNRSRGSRVIKEGKIIK